MKNIIDEKPMLKLLGRLRESMEFIDEDDINNKDVLDIGCGFGSCVMNLLSRNVKKVVGMEITDKDLETAKRYISDERAKFKLGSAIELPFENESFDTVVLWEVIEHIPKNTELQMFAEVFRVLKKGGVFYLSTPNRSALSNIFDPAWWLIGHRHYSKNDLRQFGEKNNFLISALFVRGGVMSVVMSLDMYFSKWLLGRRPLFDDWLKKKEDLEYRKEGFVNLFGKFLKNN